MAVARCGTLRAAAEELHLTQPGLSKALTELESAFGAQLFERGPRGVRPTPQGRLAIDGARVLLSELGHLQRQVTAPDPVAVLRIGAPPFIALGFLPPVLKQITSSHPSLRVELLEERSPALLSALAQGHVDVLISSFPAQPPEDIGTDFVHEKLFDASYLIIAPSTHPLATQRQVGWNQLTAGPWVLPSHAAMVRRIFEECFIREGLRTPSAFIESTSPTTNFELVERGFGLSVVPSVISAKALRARKAVVALNVVPKMPTAPVAMIRRAGPENPRIKVLRAALGSARFEP